VPPGDAESLAASRRRLAANPALRASLAREGRKRIEEEFSSAKNLDRLISAFTVHRNP
jgi:glycosyltransferase involved in cell wall biosynthesis